MEINRKHRFLIAFVSLFILISIIQETYAKYLTNASANTNMTIARWNIIVNNQDILNNSDFSNGIKPVFLGSEHIADGILAPLSEGYFDIVVDATNVDVSFNQVITLSHGKDNTVSDLAITGYSVDNGSIISFDKETTFTNEILLSDQKRIHTYRIYVKWLDGENETMDNEKDTEATKSGKASIKVDVSFIQKAN